MILSIVMFALGVFCYAIRDLQSHSKLKWMQEDDSFWGEHSYHRKYTSIQDAPPDNWYYKLFKIGYKERFPLSATALVFITDGYHLMQWVYLKLFILSIVLYSPVFTWYWDGAIYLGCWYLIFNIVYKVFSK